MAEKSKRPDQEPGFWPEWKEPDAMSQAIQYPLNDPHWQSRVINAHVAQTAKTARRALDEATHDRREGRLTSAQSV